MANVSPRADLVGALVWIAFGVSIIGASIGMDRMERFGAAAYTAPGLVPGILGAGVALLGVLMLIRSIRQGALSTPVHAGLPAAEGHGREVLVRTGLAMGLSLVYTLLLVGRGLPFWLATAVFVFVFMIVFYLPECRARGQVLRGLLTSAIVAIATSATVTLVFEKVFLVRMP
jgi:hypothetical protein